MPHGGMDMGRCSVEMMPQTPWGKAAPGWGHLKGSGCPQEPHSLCGGSRVTCGVWVVIHVRVPALKPPQQGQRGVLEGRVGGRM